MKLISSESPFVLPAGTYYLGDPCYVLSEDDYGVLMQLRWGRLEGQHALRPELVAEARKLAVEAGRDELVHELDAFSGGRCYPSEPLLIDAGKRGVMLTWQTAHGDGRYKAGTPRLQGSALGGAALPVSGLAVDSGQLALVDKQLMRKGLKRDYKNLNDISGTVWLIKPLKVRVEGGDLKARGLRVKTS